MEQLITQSIQKTGFVLEYQASQILEKHGWTVINNRYYLDDISNSAREIDLLAYKAESINNMYYYTTLLISCKKSEVNSWTFLSKKIRDHRNYDYFPVINWTNEPHLEFMLNTSDWRTNFLSEISKNDCLSKIHSIKNHVFAFQEIVNKDYKGKKKGDVNNDANIYDSISSLIKAMSYEILSLNARKKDRCFYNFQLLTIADIEFYESYFENENVTTQAINEIKYINRFIVRNKDTFQRVNFITLKIFDEWLKNYDSFHEWNSKFYSDLTESFYSDLLINDDRIKLQLKLCKHELMNYIRDELPDSDEINPKLFENIDLLLHAQDQSLSLYTYFSEEINTELNNSVDVSEHTAKWLKRWFRFDGEFKCRGS